MRKTVIPWAAIKRSGEHEPPNHGWEVRSSSGEAITGWGCVTQSEKNARLIAAACNSYRRHCPNAVAAAESDVLGMLIEACEAAFRLPGYVIVAEDCDFRNDVRTAQSHWEKVDAIINQLDTALAAVKGGQP